jgi:D-alanyl-D-alanine carboxypeptidase
VKAAHLLEQGFGSAPLSWLTPSLGAVESLTPVDAAPPNLHEEMCGSHRKRPAAEEEEEADGVNASPDSPYAVFLSSLRPQPKGGNLLQAEANLGEPVVVFTGPPRGQGTAPGAIPGTTQLASTDAKLVRPAKPGTKAAAAQSGEPAIASVTAVPWLASSPPSELRAIQARSSSPVPLPRARPRVAAEKAQLR